MLGQWPSRTEAGLMSEALGRLRLSRWSGMLTAKIPLLAMAFGVSTNIPHLNALEMSLGKAHLFHNSWLWYNA